jgi:1-acyl-sn-glycerol-3-phosphate acyltransferase
LLPVTITGTHAILPPKTLNLFPGRARMIIHAPIFVDDAQPGDVRGLMETARHLLDPANIPPASAPRS